MYMSPVNSEILYSYVAGQGWVPTPPDPSDQTITFKLGDRTVTLVRRKPEAGERAWWVRKDWTLERATEDMRQFDDYPFGWVVHELDCKEIVDANPDEIVTVLNE